MSDSVSRRRFLVSAGAVLGVGPVLAACGGGDDTVAASECAGYGDLTAQDLQNREALQYVDVSPNAAQVCSNCRLYNQPQGGSPCGGCQLFAGPVTPGGWCASWQAMS